jgi:hypothetical protein
MMSTEPRPGAIGWSDQIARLTGGPTIEFLSGRLAMVFGIFRIGQIEDHHRILPGRQQRLAVVVEGELLVVADDQ